jgi:hypothetical protein
VRHGDLHPKGWLQVSQGLLPTGGGGGGGDGQKEAMGHQKKQVMKKIYLFLSFIFARSSQVSVSIILNPTTDAK